MIPADQLDRLVGRQISYWIGTELAACTNEPVLWADTSFGYLQFLNLEVHLSDGDRVHLTAGLDDDGDYFGLYLDESALPLDVFDAHGSNFLRGRIAQEIPTGSIDLVETALDANGQVIDLTISVGGSVVRLSCGEISCDCGEVKVERPQEFVLVELSDHRLKESQSEQAAPEQPLPAAQF